MITRSFYNLQLRSHDWAIHRRMIISKHGYQCQICSNRSLIGTRISRLQSVARFYEPFAIDPSERHLIDNNPEWLFAGESFISTKREIKLNFFLQNFSLREYIEIKARTGKQILIACDNQDNPIGICSCYSSFIMKFDLADWGWVIDGDFLTRYFNMFQWLYFDALQVHHNYYVDGKYAWELPDDCYAVLCGQCHASEHKIRKIPVYRSEGEVGTSLIIREI